MKEDEPIEAVESLDQVDEYAQLIAILESHLAEYIEMGMKMELDVEGEELLGVIDLAIAHAKGTPTTRPKGDNPKEHFLFDMYEELASEPLNLFENRTSESGETYQIPISTKEWIICLKKLKASVSQMVDDLENTEIDLTQL